MSDKAELAKRALDNSNVVANLAQYSPQVVSTIFVGFDTASSDIDIVCNFVNRERFIEDLKATVPSAADLELKENSHRVVGQFEYAEFVFEIYATSTPVTQQLAYRHYQIMKRLVAVGGDSFAARVRALKVQGLKTEPALCQILSIPGDPYTEILTIEDWSDAELRVRVADSFSTED